ncbi:MAG TPA: hypothetical protein VHM31_15380 [Polyangia bacterium]|nr:hypothetical protein [Polyangia bacterium]
MERLTDSNPASGTAEAELAAAVATVEPVAVTDARQERILAAVLARTQTRGRRLSGAVFLRPAIAGAILVMAGAATAAATVGHGWVSREWHRLTGQPVAVAPAAPRPRVAHPRPISPPPVAPPPAAPAAEEVASEVKPEVPARPPVLRISARVPAAKGEDPSALVAAVRALRSEHDPQRAARLLDAYLRTYPHGALAEEALALQIEAAASMKSPRASVFAEQYLRAYPNGRFRQSARQALSAKQD